MSFDLLPDDILGKILFCLANEPTSFASLASTCKRLNNVSSSIVHTSDWVEARPAPYNLYLDLNLYMPDYCSSHGTCPEQQWRLEARCEILTAKQREADPERAPLPGPNEEPGMVNECFYHRLYCLANTKYRFFSSLKFRKTRLSDRGCVRSFQDALKLNQMVVADRIRALVELELFSCDITLDWLNTILNELENIKYLTLHEVAFTDPAILVDSKHMASRCLKRLRITGDRTYRINDSIFMYFLNNFPATEFDVTASRVEYHRRIIQRFYTNANDVDPYSDPPSEYILTFPFVLLYLKKYQAVTKKFVASETNITFISLKKILQDKDLKHLKIVCENCPMITYVERARLAEQVSASDIARVKF